MLKFFLALLVSLDAAFLLLLITAFVYTTIFGSINILLPGLGLIISSNLILILLFLFEIFLLAVTFVFSRLIKNNSGKLA